MNPQEQISQYIAGISDWRGDRLEQLRALINGRESLLTEEWKWGVPLWTHNGPVCAISAFKDHVKINFFKGAALKEFSSHFNSGLDSKSHRSINFGKGDTINEQTLADIIRAATAINSK